MTPKQREVYDFIVGMWREKGHGPTYDEIVAACDFSSKSRVYHFLEKLVEQGLLERPAAGIRARNIRPVINTTICPGCGREFDPLTEGGHHG